MPIRKKSGNLSYEPRTFRSLVDKKTLQQISFFLVCYQDDTLQKHESNGLLTWHSFFDIVTGVLQGDRLAPFLFILNLDQVLWTSMNLTKNGFTWKKWFHMKKK